MLDSSALRRGRPPPVPRAENLPCWPYQLSAPPCCWAPSSASVHTAPALFWAGRPLTHSACPSPALRHRPHGPRKSAYTRIVYRISRNPVTMFPIFFVFLGCVLITQSLPWPPSSSFKPPPTPSSGPRSAGAARPSARPTSATARLGRTLPINNRGGEPGCRRLCYFYLPALAGVPR